MNFRFTVDECTGPGVAKFLREQGHDVLSIHDDFPGITDKEIIKMSFNEHRIILTNDKDFGEKVFRDNARHHGVILLRLSNERLDNRISAVRQILDEYHDQISDNFIVITEKNIRIIRP